MTRSTAPAQPLRILLVAEDRRILRNVSRFLVTFGYEVQQVASRQQTLDSLSGESPDIVLVDGEPDPSAALEICRVMSGRESARALFIFLLAEKASRRFVLEALEAGVDDVLARPVVQGELLARLRAAARMLEFERRLQRHASVDELTGLPTQSPKKLILPMACAVIDLDQLGRVNYLYGRAQGDALVRETAVRLQERCNDPFLLRSLGGGRFAVWMSGTSEDDAVAWANALKTMISEMETSIAGETLRVNASVGVAISDEAASTGEALLARAVRSLQLAKASGRNCVARYSELSEDAAAWADFAAPDNLFQRTTARDIMTPCTILLRPDQPLDVALPIFRRSQLSALPVVDDSEKLVGLLSAESVLGQRWNGKPNVRPIAELMTADVPRFAEDAEFATLRDFFTQDARSVVVITREGKPIGLVTPDNLAALSQPLTLATFAPTAPCGDASDDLAVPDLQPLADA